MTGFCKKYWLLLFFAGLFHTLSVDGQQIVRTVAGNRTSGYTGDGGQAVIAELNHPSGVAIDHQGNIYLSDANDNVVRRVQPDGTISTFAGRHGLSSAVGDGGQADSAYLDYPLSLLIDKSGRYLYIADDGNARVRKVDLVTNIITTVTGNGFHAYTGDGGPATNAEINGVLGMCFDTSGNLYIGDGNTRVRKIDTNGIISTFAGGGAYGYSGNGGLAIHASFRSPAGVTADTNGNIYIADYDNEVVRVVNNAGVISNFAGIANLTGLTGDHGLATLAKLNSPYDLKSDQDGNVYIVDQGNSRVRMVDVTGTITTYAGTSAGFAGDGGPAISAKFSGTMYEVNFDSIGNAFIADYGNNVIREITQSPKIKITVSPGDSICYGTEVSFTTNIVDPGYGNPKYKWLINGINTGLDTGAFQTDTLSCSDTVVCNFYDPAGNYLLSSDTVVIKVMPLIFPSLSITESTDSVCYHTMITYTATAVNGGENADFVWRIYGAPAGAPSDTTFTYMAQNGDIVSCIMICDTPCARPDTVISNSFKMDILPNVYPQVFLLAYPYDTVFAAYDTVAFVGQVVNFFIQVNNGGTDPVYQWYVNQQPVPGATTNTYSRNVYYTDTVYCVVASNAPCAYPTIDTSNTTIVYASHLGIYSVNAGNHVFSLYPDPSTGSFYIRTDETITADNKVAVDITDITGKWIFSEVFPVSGGKLNLPVSLPGNTLPGLYLVNITSGSYHQVVSVDIVK